MLECNAVEGRVDEATYTHIIRMWVKDVRDRSERSSLEVTALSDSEVSVCVCVLGDEIATESHCVHLLSW